MSEDPYHEVQHEVQTSLQTASTLQSSYLRIKSTAREESEELIWARNEVRLLHTATCIQLTRVILAESDPSCTRGRPGGPGGERQVSSYRFNVGILAVLPFRCKVLSNRLLG